MMNTITGRRDDRERGQIIVLFALALVAVIAAIGLVLDGGSAYAQRRDEQSAADLAALAGANDYLINHDNNLAIARARLVASQNGYAHGVKGVAVNVIITITNGVEMRVSIDAPHANNFASIVGMPSWRVSTQASSLAGFPDTVVGAGPIIFSIDAFSATGQPKAQYGNPSSPYAFGEGNGDVPNGPGDIAWTNYGTGNVNTSTVRGIIDGSVVISKTLAFNEYIGQHNNGNHTALYSEVQQYLAGTNIPVPVVDHSGNFQGWATFHVVSASGGSAKDVVGYFVSPFVNQRLTVGDCGALSCPRYLGTYVLKLTN
jgi:Flp pilus assembly protein TadG